MSNITKNALKGYGFQWEVTVLFCFMMDFYPSDFCSIKPEYKEGDNHNFDDINVICKKETYYVQVKNYKSKVDKFNYNEKEQYILLGTNRIKLFQNKTNILVLNKIDGIVENNSFFYNLPSYSTDDGHVIIINVTPDEIYSYIKSKCISLKRENRLSSLFRSRLLERDVITIGDIPTIDFFDNNLIDETVRIRDNIRIKNSGVVFITAPPGYGKSHLANEISDKNTILYRFWVSQDDTAITTRLKYDSFIEQISFQVDKNDHTKRNASELALLLKKKSKTLVIDGLDHVFTYNQIDVDNYINFIDECNKNNTSVIVLSRPISNHFYEKYHNIELKLWNKNDCFRYCDYFAINDIGIKEEIYKYTKGYPIIVHYLCEEFLQNGGKLITKKFVASVDEYYADLLQNGGYEYNLKRLQLITILLPYFHYKDLDILYDNSLGGQIDSLLKDYPHLVYCKNRRVFFYHESIYQYIKSKTPNDYYVGLNKKILVSLMNGEIIFMSRVLLDTYTDKEIKRLIKKYCQLDFFNRIITNNIDYESVAVMYHKILDILSRYETNPLSPLEMYNLSIILLLLNHNYYYDNPLLTFLISYQFKLNMKPWDDYVFSNDVLYSNLVKTESYSGIIDRKNYYFNSRPTDLIDLIHQDQKYFNVLEYDSRKVFEKYLKENNNYVDSEVFAEYLVSGYIHDKGTSYKSLINLYLEELDSSVLVAKANEYFSFIKKDSNSFPIRHACTKAVLRLRCLGVIPGIMEYKNIKALLNNYKDLDSYEMSELLNGFIRYNNYRNNKLDLADLYPYFYMMDAYKDPTILYVPEALAFYAKNGIFTLHECYCIIKKVYTLIDSGHRGFATTFINEFDSSYIKTLVENGFFDGNKFPVFISDLPTRFINRIPVDYVLKYLSSLRPYNSENGYYFNERDFGNLLSSEHKNNIYMLLDYYNIQLKCDNRDEPQQKKRKFRKEDIEKPYFVPECLALYKKYGFSPIELASLPNGWGYKFFDPEIFKIFNEDVIRNNMEDILFAGFMSKGGRYGQYFQYNAPLVYTIPSFYKMYKKEFDCSKSSESFKWFLNIILRFNDI